MRQFASVSIQTLLTLLVFRIIFADNLGILLGTLYTFQTHACDGQTLYINCPQGSTVNIQFAQYGRQIPSHQMCPYRRYHLASFAHEDTDCIASSSLQLNCVMGTGSVIVIAWRTILLMVLLDHCQDKRHCRVTASTAEFDEDPCPQTGKYLEVAYKCRPNEFRSKVACEGDVLRLRCQKGMRLLIYSAMFGRSGNGNPACAGFSTTDVTDCQSPYSLEEVMKQCHGRRHCSVNSSVDTFGDPCQRGTFKYLNTVYACVPRRILKQIKNIKNNQKDQRTETNGETPANKNFNEYNPSHDRPSIESPGADGAPSFVPKPSTYQYDNLLTLATDSIPSDAEDRQTPAVGEVLENDSDSKPPDPNVNRNNINYGVFCNYTIAPQTDTNPPIGYLADWFSSADFLHQNSEKAILYLVVGMCTGLILVLLVIIVRLIYSRHKKMKQQKLDVTEHVASPAPTTNDLAVDNSETIDMLQFNVHGTLRNQDTVDRRFSNYYS